MRSVSLFCAAFLTTGSLLTSGCALFYPAVDPVNKDYIEYLRKLPKRQADPNPIAHDSDSHWDGGYEHLPASIVIDLSDQKAYFYRGPHLVGKSRVSTGTAERRTPSGSFKVTQKDLDHRSNLYGDFVDDEGNVVQKDVDARTDVPPEGAKFLGAAMFNFLRFNKGIGMHTGFLPGYNASHGCVRMPDHMAKKFYQNAELKTPVTVRP